MVFDLHRKLGIFIFPIFLFSFCARLLHNAKLRGRIKRVTQAFVLNGRYFYKPNGFSRLRFKVISI